MTDHDALLAAVLADPDDDGPRLVMADLLDDLGQPERAELIRVQCKLARIIERRPGHNGGTSTGMIDPMVAWRESVDALRRREAELLRDHGHEWRVCWPNAWGGRGWHEKNVFRRGFVEAILIDAADWLAHGDTILSAHPVVSVRLTTWPEVEYSESDCLRLVGDTEWIPVNRTADILEREGMPDDLDQLAYWSNDSYLMLKARWPRVREWHLPPEPMTYHEAARAYGLPDQLADADLIVALRAAEEATSEVRRRLGLSELPPVNAAPFV